MMIGTAACVLIFAFSALAMQRPVAYEYIVRVPSGVPARLLWYTKDGLSGYEDGGSRYKALHRLGWKFCVFWFLTDQIDVRRNFPEDQPPISETLFVQGPGVPGFDAQQDGYRDCWHQLRRKVMRFGHAQVRHAVMERELRKDR